LELIKTIRTNAEKKLVKSHLTSYLAQLKDSKLHDLKYRNNDPSPRTIKLEGKIEVCKELLGI
jgi:hypothetical protein